MEAATKPVLAPGEIADTIDALIDALAEERDRTVRDRVSVRRCLDRMRYGDEGIDDHRAEHERLGRRARRLSHAITQLEDGVLWTRYAIRDDADPMAEAEAIMDEALAYVVKVTHEEDTQGGSFRVDADDTVQSLLLRVVREFIADQPGLQDRGLPPDGRAAVTEFFELVHRGTVLDPAESLVTVGVLAADREALVLRRRS